MAETGKTTCDINFIANFLDAYDEMKRTGKEQPIKGTKGLRVTPVKEDELHG